MTFEELRVIVIVYVAALLPIYLIILKRSSLPHWVPAIYIGAFLACAIGWSFGLPMAG